MSDPLTEGLELANNVVDFGTAVAKAADVPDDVQRARERGRQRSKMSRAVSAWKRLPEGKKRDAAQARAEGARDVLRGLGVKTVKFPWE